MAQRSGIKDFSNFKRQLMKETGPKESHGQAFRNIPIIDINNMNVLVSQFGILIFI